MKQKMLLAMLFCIAVQITYSQIDDLLKTEIPGLDLWQPGSAITTSFDDAYQVTPWLNNFDILNTEKFKKENNNEGYFYTWLESYCLKAGKRGPVSGNGYLLAPLKGNMKEIIKNILSRRNIHPEISREDVQLLLWAIESGTNFRDLDPGLQARVLPLLTSDEILKLNFKTNDVLDLLPDELKEAANYYRGLRQMILDPRRSFSEIEQFAVPVNINALLPIDSIYDGAWNYIGKGYYARSYSGFYTKSFFEFYKPMQVVIARDAKNRITGLKSGNYFLEISYTETPELIEGKYPADKFAVVKVTASDGSTFVINNSGWVVSRDFKYSGIGISNTEYSNQLTSDEFIRRTNLSMNKLNGLKEYAGKLKSKKKAGLTEQEILGIYEITEALRVLLNNDRSLNIDSYDNAYDMINNAEYYSNSKFCNQTGNISGQSNPGLFDLFSGLTMVPANTTNQRLGTGGYEADPDPGSVGNPRGRPRRPRTTGDPTGTEGNNGSNNTGNENDTGECSPVVFIKQISSNYLPIAGSEVIVELDVQAGPDCRVESVKYILRDVSSNLGVCINDKRVCYNTSLDAFFRQSNNPGLNISPDSLRAEGEDIRRVAVTINDYAAHCMLEVQVKINGTWYNASEEQTGNTMISIPVDRDGDAIADAWETHNNVEGKLLTWDEDEPLQNNRGDGLTLFEEYRGLFEKLPSGELQYLRTNPLKKEMCVIDDNELLSISVFERLTGINLVKLDESSVYGGLAGGDDTIRYRWVNFASTNNRGVKYAIRIIKQDGIADPYRNKPESIKGYCDLGPPINVKRCVIFPDRIRKSMLEVLPHVIDSALASTSDEIITFRDSRNVSENYHRNFLESVLGVLRDPNRNYLAADFFSLFVVSHEIMHGCSVDHHGRGVDGMQSSGNKLCVMYYRHRVFSGAMGFFILSLIPPDWFERNNTAPIIVANLGTMCGMPGLTGTFPDDCYRQININDRLGR